MSSTVFSDVAPYPVNLRLIGRPVLVVGAGNVAVRKVQALVTAGAEISVVAPVVDERLITMAWAASSNDSPGSIEIERRRYRTGEVASYMLSITCTNDAEVNEAVFRDGRTAGVWVNSADDPQNCDFTLPSVVRRDDLQITVSTGGRSPALAMWLRQRLEAEFDATWSALLDLLAEVRSELQETRGTSEVTGWLDALDDGLHDLVTVGEIERARAVLRKHLDLGPTRDVATIR